MSTSTMVRFFTVGWNFQGDLVPLPVLKVYKPSRDTVSGIATATLVSEDPLEASIKRNCILFQAFGLYPEIETNINGIWFPPTGADWLISKGIVSSQNVRSAYDAIWDIRQRILDAESPRCQG
jgi:hypothetical protein